MGGSSPYPGERTRRPARKRKLLPLYLLLAVIAALLVAVAAFLPRQGRPPVRLPELNYDNGGSRATAEPSASVLPARNGTYNKSTAGEPGARTSGGTGSQGTPSRAVVYQRSAGRGKLIFVIDDVGNNVEELRPFLRFPGPLTLSVMPQRPYTLEAYHMILDAGKVPILHQPMQADGSQNPGAGAIYTSMTRQQIDTLLTRNLAEMPEITWMNNHEGSKATSDIRTMTDVLSYLKGRGMHFLDSRTTTATVVKQADLRLGLPYYHRNSLFLDDVATTANIEKEINSGLQVAQEQGYAVMIGHVWDRELPSILISLYPRLLSEGYQFADIRSLVKEARPNAGIGD